jgi:hypothetical protein
VELLRTIIVFAALLHGSAAFASEDPCALADVNDVERVLGGAIVAVPVEEIGEETAPYCLWATAGRKAEIKLEIWSDAELPVLNMPDAESYFVKLEAEARSQPGFMPLDGFGARAFEAEGSIVVLKTGRVIVVDFAGVRPERVRALVRQMVARL